MKLFKEGDKSRALCPNCQQLQSTTFAERDVPLSSGKGLVKDVLVAVCDACDSVVSVPQQSVPRIKETLNYSRFSLEARLPRHLVDAVGLACHDLGFTTAHSPVMFRVYLKRFHSLKGLRKKLPKLSSSEEARGRAGARFSAKLSDEFHTYLRDLARENALKNSDIVRGICLQIKQDILDRKDQKMRYKLKEILPFVDK